MKKILHVLIILFIYSIFTYSSSINSGYNIKLGNIYYNSLQEAYNNAKNGDVIKLKSSEESIYFVLLNRSINITIEGGYDNDWDLTDYYPLVFINESCGSVIFYNLVFASHCNPENAFSNKNEKEKNDFISNARSFFTMENKEIFALLSCEECENNLKIQKLLFTRDKYISKYRFDFVRDNDLKSHWFRVRDSES